MLRKNSHSTQITQHTNRNSGKRTKKNTDTHTVKTERGMQQICKDNSVKGEEYKLSWFKPSDAEKEIIYSMCQNDLTVVQGGSGCGKSTTAIFQALHELKKNHYKQLIFVKTPSEIGDDAIGYLTGDANQKLEVHFESMRSIFHTFMSKAKLEMDEKREKIQFTIPNFCAGKTFYESIIIIDEAQLLSENTLKMLLERISDCSKLVVLGDAGQRYSVKKRNDGLTNFIDLITEVDEEGRYSVEELMGYVALTAKDNMRGKLSKRIGELYEEES